MRIAVTGAAGTVGPYIVEELVGHGHEVVGVDLHASSAGAASVVRADVEDLPSLVTAFEGCDAVIHLAALREPRLAPPDVTFRLNAMGTFNAIEAAVAVGATRFVFASSDAVLGIPFHERPLEPVYLPVDEDHPVLPQDDYGLSKLVGEEICRSYTRKGVIATACLRHCYFWTPTVGDEALQVVEDVPRGARTLWSYIHARDCARAYRMACESLGLEHETLFIVARDVHVNEPSADLAQRFYPEVEVRRPLLGHGSLISGARAQERLSFIAERSWRDEVTRSSAGVLGYAQGAAPPS